MESHFHGTRGGQDSSSKRPAVVTVVTAVIGALESEIAAVLATEPAISLQRRCADISELMGLVQAGIGKVAIISSALPGFDRQLIAQLQNEGVTVLAINDPLDQYSAQRIAALGVTFSLAADEVSQRLIPVVLEASRANRPSVKSGDRPINNRTSDRKTSRSNDSFTSTSSGLFSEEVTLIEETARADSRLQAGASSTDVEATMSREALIHLRRRNDAQTGSMPPVPSVDQSVSTNEAIAASPIRQEPVAEAGSSESALSADLAALFASLHSHQETQEHLSGVEAGSPPEGTVEYDRAGHIFSPHSANSSSAESIETRPSGEDPLHYGDLSGAVYSYTFDPRDRLAPRTTPTSRGKTIVVWSGHGAPGRSTIAAGLAFALSLPRDYVTNKEGRVRLNQRISSLISWKSRPKRTSVYQRTLLVDADTYAPSQAQALGLLEESSGLAQACRSANAGVLNDVTMADAALGLGSEVDLLTGIPRQDRWSEVSVPAFEAVLEQANNDYDWTVVDCAPNTEMDEMLMYESRSPQRNGVTLCALERADLIVVVGKPDPVGIKRLINAVNELQESLGTTVPQVVAVNHAPSRVSGRNRRNQIEKALKRFANVDEFQFLAYDLEAATGALEIGRALAEKDSTNELVNSIHALATLVRSGFEAHGR